MATRSTLNFMKRRCFPVILLSAALLAAQVCALGQSNVYSVNVVSVHFAGQHSGGLAYERIWSTGPFEVGEIKYWTDVSGRAVGWDPSRTDKRGDTHHCDTRIRIGAVSFSVPLAPRWTGGVGILILATLLSCSFIAVARRTKIHRLHTC